MWNGRTATVSLKQRRRKCECASVSVMPTAASVTLVVVTDSTVMGLDIVVTDDYYSYAYMKATATGMFGKRGFLLLRLRNNGQALGLGDRQW